MCWQILQVILEEKFYANVCVVRGGYWNTYTCFKIFVYESGIGVLRSEEIVLYCAYRFSELD